MRNQEESLYVKRTQKDYSMSFKLQLVQEIEHGSLIVTDATKKYNIQCRKTVLNWLKKLGNFDWDNQIPMNMEKSPQQKVMELEVQVKLLQRQKALLKQQAQVADSKAIIFDMMIDIAEKVYKIDIRKNSSPEQSIVLENNKNKQYCLPVICSG